MSMRFAVMTKGSRPLIAAAIHNGHALRDELADFIAIDEQTRFREEDPYTSCWTTISDSRVVLLRSRFEVDVNRPPKNAIYRHPADAWGLDVWRGTLPPGVIAHSQLEYKIFYAALHELCERMINRFGKIVVFDLHSYNHRRPGPDAPEADPEENPGINLGTGTLDRERWAPVVETFLERMKEFGSEQGELLDVRENVKFRGGYFTEWIHENFPRQACALAIDVKKTFMNEWTGVPRPVKLRRIGRALKYAADGILERLEAV